LNIQCSGFAHSPNSVIWPLLTEWGVPRRGFAATGPGVALALKIMRLRNEL
jgi:hypothetical protein